MCAGKSREAEKKRINKELANIRSKFKGEDCKRDRAVHITILCILTGKETKRNWTLIPN